MILVTGANGFLGHALSRALQTKGLAVRGAVRSTAGDAEINVGDIGPDTDWKNALADVGVIVHTAARVHAMSDTADDPHKQYRQVNVEGTLNLARQAASAKVKRLIFISSVKVNGESTVQGKPFTTDDHPQPDDPYSVSKWEAEVGLQKLARETGLEVTIIRAPLVYGPGVKANFRRMMRWVNLGLPLPLGSIDNKRSLIAIDNLVDLIITCIEHPAAANQTFMAGDGQDLSTTELVRAIGRAMGKPVRLYPCPAGLLLLAASLLGKRVMVQRLIGNLQIDISLAKSLLDWMPPVSLEEGLRRTVQDFVKQSQ
jgi:nucleoside-diphosphate-sugar epimerase